MIGNTWSTYLFIYSIFPSSKFTLTPASCQAIPHEVIPCYEQKKAPGTNPRLLVGSTQWAVSSWQLAIR